MQKSAIQTLFTKINFFAALFIIFWSTNLILVIDSTARTLAIIAAIVWFGTTFLIDPTFFFSYKLKITILMVWVIIIIFYMLFQNRADMLIYRINTIIFFLLGLISIHSAKIDPSQLKWFFWVAIISLMFFSVTSLIGYLTYPSSARMLSHSFAGDEFYISQGIGGYSFIYAIVLMIPVLVYIIKQRKFFSAIFVFIIVSYFVLSVILILLAGYFYAVVITLFILFSMLFLRKFSLPMILILTISVLFVIFLPKDGLTNTLSQVSNVVENQFIARKLNDIIINLQTGEVGGTISGRIEKYTADINTIMEYPILGNLDSQGGQSQFLYLTAQFGIFMGITYLYLCVSFTYDNALNPSISQDDPLYFLTIVLIGSFLMLMFLNSISYELGIPLFIFPAYFSHYYIPRTLEKLSIKQKSGTAQSFIQDIPHQYLRR